MQTRNLLIAVTLAAFLATSRAEQKGGTMAEFKLSSPGFRHNQPVPAKFTCEGKDASPALKWEGAPAETKSFALICDDPDAQSVAGFVWVHWVIWGIPAAAVGLTEDVAKTENVPALGGAKQGENSGRGLGYSGPCPPRGHGVHHYHFKLYALGTEELALKPHATKQQLEDAMRGHVLTVAELVGTYQRK
jgi:Raf kinase inhibitor-like YbhB/YbcL family protein